MMRQTRPFIVEVKHKRGAAKQNRSIWGDIDLATIAAEAAKESEKAQLADRRLVDSDPPRNDAEDVNKPRVVLPMANPHETESGQALTDTSTKAEPAEPKKNAPRQNKTAKGQPKRSAAKEAAKVAISEPISPVPAKAPRKIYSEKERAQKLSQIEKAIAGGASSKSAVSQAGISEQTYYQWKKAAAPAPESDALKDLVALEEENKRLKKMLAEHLRKENAELKSRLGLA
ncbi:MULTISPECIES: transposase [unclassified Mesorhizobium]|uniref:transposase n=2 Tax=Pseudomonadota TaxID=1224 RepID=UPI000B328EB6|nr:MULTISPECIES: transposase [unclassified Mesorhizobium]